MRHRFAVTNWLTAAYRTVQLVGRQTVHLGGTLPRKVSTGEVVAIGTNDLSHIGQLMDVSARFAGAIVSFLLVSVILLSTSVTLGLVVLVGVPLLMLLIGPLLSPLQKRSAHQRHLMGDLNNTASDIVSGLRVLRGIGGEQVFLDRYRRESQTTRRAGVAGRQAAVRAGRAPGLAARRLRRARGLAGSRYAVAGTIIARRAGRVLRLLGLPDDPAAHRDRVRQQGDPRARRGRADLPGAGPRPRRTPTRRDRRPSAAARLRPVRRPHRPARARRPADRRRVASSPTSPPRSPTGSACARRAVDDDVRLGGVPLTSLRRDEVRRRIVVSDTGATFFSGRLGDRLDVTGLGRRRPRARHRLGRRHPRGAPRRPRHRGRRARPQLLRRPAAAAGAGPRARRRPRDPGAGRADVAPSTRTPRPGSPAGCARTGPAAPPSSLHQPADARRRGRGRVPPRRPDRRDRHARRPARHATPRTAPSSPARRRPSWRRRPR